MNRLNESIRAYLLLLAVAAGFVILGCERKETLLDVDTPGTSVEVERSTDTGEVDVSITDKD
ncbi:hypothetical protein [Neorhodopirellula lusitana]|uniref:hypothetical protein n=1 Tax=Neorhodopirellula lusitana TaxID=445327 RepID=UPI003850071E